MPESLSPPFAHCPRCTATTGVFLRQHEYRCPECGFRYFHNVASAAGILAQRGQHYLFLERNQDPAKGKLGLPGGFVDPGERVEEALQRELREEIGAEISTPGFVASFPNQYTFEGITYHTCDLYFKANILTPDAELHLDCNEVRSLIWLDIQNVAPEALAFDSLRALQRLLLDQLH